MTVMAQKTNNMKKGPFKLKSGNKPSIAKLVGISPAKAVETPEEKKARLAKHKERMKKSKAFYEKRKDEFTKDKEGVYRDSEGLSVKERRRIYNQEKAAQERDRKKYETKDPR